MNRLVCIMAACALAAATAPAGAEDGDPVARPPIPFAVHAVQIENLNGRLQVDVKDAGPVWLAVSGKPGVAERIVAKNENGILQIRDTFHPQTWGSRQWHWHDVLRIIADWPKAPVPATVHLVVPRNTSLRIGGFNGNAVVGDTGGSLAFGVLGSGTLKAGAVTDADISVSGSGDVRLADVTGMLRVDVSGSGKIVAGRVGSADASVAGSGSVTVGRIAHGLRVDINGSGDFYADTINGPVDVDIAGVGKTDIGGGTADPLKVRISGCGDFRFGGVAINPDIDFAGVGHAWLKAYRGSLHKSDGADVKIGP